MTQPAPTVPPPDAATMLLMALAMKQFPDLEKVMTQMQNQTALACEMLSRQTKMLDIGLDIIIKLAEEESTPMQIRRRLAFALQQIRGVGMP